MQTHSVRLTSSPVISIVWPGLRLLRRVRQFLFRCVRFARYCDNHFAATSQHDELSKLSDAALERRGIARGDLHRHLADSL
jgi:hypothetical protein